MRARKNKAKGADNKKKEMVMVNDCCDLKNKKNYDQDIFGPEVDILVKD